MSENEKIQFTIRIEKDLFEKVKKIASDESRNINGQIEFIIKKFLEIKG